MKKIFSFVLLVISFTTCGFGQKKPMIFGSVSKDDLEMKVYPSDTTVPAAILCDYGHFNSQTYKFTRLVRIKIFKKEGTSLGNYSFDSSKDTWTKGTTFNLENGKIVETRLNNESIFSERITGNRYRTRVAMPNVKAGSVIDLEITMTSIPQVWKFQDLIPVMYSELIMDWSQYISFRSNFYGFEHLEVATPTRWVGKNMPSFKIEPYMNSSENYITKLEFTLLKYMDHDFSSTWEKVSETLMKYSDFGDALLSSAFLNSLSKNIMESKKSKDEMVRMACDSVRKLIRWNEVESLLPSNPTLSTRLKLKTGNSSDINLILIQLLKKLDIETKPVVLSTRSNGMLTPFHANIDKLNYVIAMSKTGEKTYLLDATDQYLPYNLLPLRCLNYEGRLVDELKSDPVILTSSGKDKWVTYYDMKMMEDNTLSGNISVQHYDYSSSELRRKFYKFNSQEEYIEEYKKDKPGLVINNLKLNNLDSIYLPFGEYFDVSIRNQVNSSGSEIFLQPLLYERLKENPFKAEDRKYPVDFGLLTENTVVMNYTIPEKYTVVSMPEKVVMRTEGNQLVFQYEVSQFGSVIKVLSKFSINKSLFMPDEYKELKEFYNQVIVKQSEPIILKAN